MLQSDANNLSVIQRAQVEIEESRERALRRQKQQQEAISARVFK